MLKGIGASKEKMFLYDFVISDPEMISNTVCSKFQADGNSPIC